MWNTLALFMAAPKGGGNEGLVLFIQFAAIIAIFWFLLIRPQRNAQKKHKAMVEALKRGDEVMTEGGIVGQVVHIKEDRVTIQSGENARVVVARAKIARVYTGEEPPSKER